ncbi:MAG: 30S ribosomal protein S16 [Bacilli bacterium]
MAVKIRLARSGRHQTPFYRIVAADSRYSKDGRYLEQIGYYNPDKGVEGVTLNEELAIKWVNLGAQYSNTLKAILIEKGILAKAKTAKENKPVKKNVVSTKSKKVEKKAK